MDLYKILGVAKDATKDQIKQSFRRLVKEAHPDAGGDEDTFNNLTGAYKILVNDDLRLHYDATGEIKQKVEANQFALAQQELRNKFDQVIDKLNADGSDISTTDVISLMRQTIWDEIEGRKKKRVAVSLSKEIWQEIHDRIVHEDEDKNFLRHHVSLRIKECESRSVKLREENALSRRALKLLEGFKYDMWSGLGSENITSCVAGHVLGRVGR